MKTFYRVLAVLVYFALLLFFASYGPMKTRIGEKLPTKQAVKKADLCNCYPECECKPKCFCYVGESSCCCEK